MIWHSSYETGNTMVDNDHKEIFALVQKVLDAAFKSREEKVVTAIDFLSAYVLQHFAREERLMEESAYPDFAVHKKQHSDFVPTVVKLREQAENNSQNLDISLEVNKVIVNWLTEHVLGSDKLMADHYRRWTASRRG